MGWGTRYENAKAMLLADTTICAANRGVWREFFEFEERKLKRQNGLRALDDACYKTLYGYVLKFRNVNRWFGNKPWEQLTRDDIRRVYDGLEDGKIRAQSGAPFQDRASYYNKIFKSKPFRMIGKAELAKDVIEYATTEHKEVRFVTEDVFRTMVSVLSKPQHLLLFWLAWDIGENVGTLLQLTKADFVRQTHGPSGEPEYLVHLPRRKLKRSRQERAEPTLYLETVRYADVVLAALHPNDLVFQFGHRQALKLLHSVAKRTGMKCQPHGDRPMWKDLRSGMACHLFKNGWTREEVNARLGHVPHSRALDVYVNHLALDRSKAKEKLRATGTEELQVEVARARLSEKRADEAVRRQTTAIDRLRAELRQTQQGLEAIRALVHRLLRALDLPADDAVSPAVLDLP